MADRKFKIWVYYNLSPMLLSTLFLLKGVDFMTSLRKREKRSRPKRETGNYYSFFSSSFFFGLPFSFIRNHFGMSWLHIISFFFLFRIEKKKWVPLNLKLHALFPLFEFIWFFFFLFNVQRPNYRVTKNGNEKWWASFKEERRRISLADWFVLEDKIIIKKIGISTTLNDQFIPR